MWQTLKNILIGIFSTILIVAVGTSAYTAWASADESTVVEATAQPVGTPAGNGNVNDDAHSLNINASVPLTEEEKAALLYMREEEKLARDVYLALYDVWGQPTFQNIASSEQMHMDAVKSLLDAYGLDDPIQGAGQFTNPDLQALYEQLVAQGGQSLTDALKVGAAIEEIDILDLQERLAQTSNPFITQVFTSLMNGSYNHLQAFVGVMEAQTSETYQPQYLSQEAYDSIIQSTNPHGQDAGADEHGNSGNTSSHGGYGQGRRGGSNAEMTDGATVTWEGTVSAFDSMTLTVLLADGSTQEVDLGNMNYVSSLNFTPQTGDPVTVTALVSPDGFAAAIEVVWNGQTYAFRDENGLPLWHGSCGRHGNH